MAKAQSSGVTPPELMRYAIAIDSLEKLTARFNEVSLKLTHDSKITAARQKQLAQTQGDSTKLAQIKATAYERAYLQRVTKQRTAETKKFREAYQSVITDYVGDNTFSKVNSKLKTDAKLKHIFDSVTQTLKRKAQ
ncbi:MAG TPA: hypothetical protein VFM90_05165 [Cyclobacteriaceae bacterium]|nr:hypothetical protein [Cyclobacteriaceae bacterium]